MSKTKTLAELRDLTKEAVKLLGAFHDFVEIHEEEYFDFVERANSAIEGANDELYQNSLKDND